MRLSEVATMTGGALCGADVDCVGVVTDSRAPCAGALFVALRGPNFDGHDFLDAASRQGASALLVDRPGPWPLPAVQVDDTRRALGRFAAAWRRQCPARAVGVTGSNGKTTVKEMIAAVCAASGPTLATRGNLNNDLGVPLTLLRLTAEHRFVVVEMGANHPGEIAALAPLAGLEVAVITNAGAAHLQGFGSVEGVARAKGELLAALPVAGVAVLNADDAHFPLWREQAAARRVVTFGMTDAADVRLVADSFTQALGPEGFVSRFDVLVGGRCVPAELALAGRHNALNATAALAVAEVLGLEIAQAQHALARMSPVAGRLEVVHGRGGAFVLNDTYNANPDSFAAALDVLTHCPGEGWVALGGFGELGADSAEWHARLGRMARAAGVTRLFATGPDAGHAVTAFGEGARHFATQDALVHTLGGALGPGTVLLVKGSRSQKMERVVEALRAITDPRACC